MAKDLSVTVLFDVYGQLLTEKQRFAVDLYYNEDLSLAEIAEQIGISRQGVRDSVKQGEKHLRGFEEKLGIISRSKNISLQIKRINEIISEVNFDGRQELLEITDRILHEI